MKWLGVLVLCAVCQIEAYKILVCYSIPVRSLSILGQGAVRHLLNDGHEVTYITNFPLNIPESKTFRQIDISSMVAGLENDDQWSIRHILDGTMKRNTNKQIQEFAYNNAKETFNHKNVIKFLEESNQHFDVVLVDFLESEVYAGLAALYNCPMIWMYSMGAHWQVVRLIGDPGNPAYDADYLGTNYPPLSFVQRVEELWGRISWYFYKTFVAMPIERNIYEETFGPLIAKKGRELPNYEDLIFNVSMIFANEHHAILGRPSTPQNFKYIGGFHIEEPAKPLPKDLQDLMDKAPHGVIYFSMGSFWKSKMLPIELVRALLNMFGELKQTVIWKYEEDLKDVPKNVRILKWAPQPSILAHPNCKFFITHGGLLSSIESVHFGVPIIGIPVLFDQYINIRKAIVNGYALKVDLTYDLPKNLKAAIEVMLGDDTYAKRAKDLSSIYHDRPVKPGTELVHWVRHVVRTRGATHLRSPALHVPLYQRMYLDLLALIIVFLFVVKKLVFLIFKKGNKNVPKKKKN